MLPALFIAPRGTQSAGVMGDVSAAIGDPTVKGAALSQPAALNHVLGSGQAAVPSRQAGMEMVWDGIQEWCH